MAKFYKAIFEVPSDYEPIDFYVGNADAYFDDSNAQTHVVSVNLEPMDKEE